MTLIALLYSLNRLIIGEKLTNNKSYYKYSW